jgi:phage tail-like protein
MTDDQRDDGWARPKFSFVVDIEGVAANTRFQEISGIDVESAVIEYRAGNSPTFSTVRMPGIAKQGNVTLKKGIFAKDNKLFEWYTKIGQSAAKRSKVTIRLLDERGAPVIVWTLANAWPTKIHGTDLKSDANEVAVESIELSHEGLTITNG